MLNLKGALLLLLLATVAAAAPYYVHISDTHVDQGYAEGAPTECALHRWGFPCCHKGDGNESSPPAGRFGDTNCDAPAALVAEIVAQLGRMYPAPQFVLFTGDATSHNVLTDWPSTILSNWQFHLEAFAAAWPGVPVVAALGNHDVFPFDTVGDKGDDSLLNDTAQLFAKYGVLRDADAVKSFATLGRYQIRGFPAPGARALVVNSMYNMEENSAVNHSDAADPGGQDAWLEAAVAEAEAAGEKVWVLGHISPTTAMSMDRFVARWNSLLARHPRTVVASLFGHTHHDQLSISRSGFGTEPLWYASMTPGATPLGGIWPSARIVEYDPSTLVAQDWHTFHVDVAKANAAGAVTLEKFYSFREAFGVKDLSLASVAELAESILNNETVASNYLRFYSTSGAVPVGKPCEKACRVSAYCHVAYNTAADISKCMSATQQQQQL